MKKLLGILFCFAMLLTAVTGCSNQTETNTEPEEETVEEKQYVWVSEKSYVIEKEGEEEYLYYELSRTNDLIKEVEETSGTDYNKDGSVYEHFTQVFKYNENGDEIYYYETTDLDNEEYVVETEYDDQGRKTLATTTVNGEVTQIKTYEYGDNTYRLICTYDGEVSDENLVSKSEQVDELDDNGNVTFAVQTKTEDGKTTISTYTYTYNDMGQKIKTEVMQDGEVTQTTDYTYDEHGNIIEKLTITYDTDYGYSERIVDTYQEV